MSSDIWCYVQGLKMPQKIFLSNRTIQCSASRSVKYDTVKLFFTIVLFCIKILMNLVIQKIFNKGSFTNLFISITLSCREFLRFAEFDHNQIWALNTCSTIYDKMQLCIQLFQRLLKGNLKVSDWRSSAIPQRFQTHIW